MRSNSLPKEFWELDELVKKLNAHRNEILHLICELTGRVVALRHENFRVFRFSIN